MPKVSPAIKFIESFYCEQHTFHCVCVCEGDVILKPQDFCEYKIVSPFWLPVED